MASSIPDVEGTGDPQSHEVGIQALLLRGSSRGGNASLRLNQGSLVVFAQAYCPLGKAK
jgi:hypothetical protein